MYRLCQMWLQPALLNGREDDVSAAFDAEVAHTPSFKWLPLVGGWCAAAAALALGACLGWP